MMTMQQAIISLIGAIISGVLATILTLFINYRQQVKKQKRDLVLEIFGYRYELGKHVRTSNDGGLMKALNQVPIAFHKNKNVIDAHKELHQICSARTRDSDDAFVTLLKEMCKDAGIHCKDWNDSMIKNVFMVNETSADSKDVP